MLNTLSLRTKEPVRHLVLWVGVTASVACFLLLALALLQPVRIERWARAAIAMEVQDRVGERLHAIDEERLVKSAERIFARNNIEIAQAKAALTRELPSQIALVIDAMLHPDCPCRARASAMEQEQQAGHIALLEKNKARLTALIESKYRDVAHSLLREVKIFTAANGTVFLLLTITAWCWRRPPLQLLAPALVMVAAAGMTCALYVFKQDWLHTILLGDYVGLYYIPYLLVALGFLSDVVFNRGRFTLLLLGGTLAVVGGIVGAAAC